MRHPSYLWDRFQIYNGRILRGFSSDVKSAGDAVVSSCIEIYHRMCTELLTTPCYTTLYLRDLSKVIQGIRETQRGLKQNRVCKAVCPRAQGSFTTFNRRDWSYLPIFFWSDWVQFLTSFSTESSSTLMYGDFWSGAWLLKIACIWDIWSNWWGNILDEYLRIQYYQ
jgi:hypothetical protein